MDDPQPAHRELEVQYIGFVNHDGQYYAGRGRDGNNVFGKDKFLLYPNHGGVLLGMSRSNPEILGCMVQEFKVTIVGEPKRIMFSFEGMNQDANNGESKNQN